jgi:hypothetical protein
MNMPSDSLRRGWLSPLVYLSNNWISLVGVVIVTTATVLWLFLLPATLRGETGNPYLGILAYLAFPAVFIGGLILTGWPGSRRRMRETVRSGLRCPPSQFAMNPRRTPQWIGHHHSRDQLANLQCRSGPASSPAMRVAQPGPKPAKPFALPAGDRFRLNIDQRIAPTGPQAAQGDPEHSIQGEVVRTGRLRFRRKAARWSRSAAFSRATAS